MFNGFYKCEFTVNDAVGRSVMYVNGGRMLGGNSAFAHIGSYDEADGEIVSDITIQRHNSDPSYRSLLGDDDASIKVRGRADADGKTYRFAGGSTQMPDCFRSVMTPLNDEIGAPVGRVGDGGIVNGLYSIHIRMLDGLSGGNTGVMLLHDGRILGGDAFFYYLGSYTSANGRWKAEMLNQEHTPARGEHPLFGGHEVGMGFSGTCDDKGAKAEATALVGKRSIRIAAVLTLLRRA